MQTLEVLDHYIVETIHSRNIQETIEAMLILKQFRKSNALRLSVQYVIISQVVKIISAGCTCHAQNN